MIGPRSGSAYRSRGDLVKVSFFRARIGVGLPGYFYRPDSAKVR
jgi:hypothetical protein